MNKSKKIEAYEEKDFKDIYENTYKDILKFIVIRCNNIDDVNDIIQDTYYELLRILKKGKFKKEEEIEKYLYGISKNVIKRYYSKRKKEKNIINFPEEYESKDDTISIEDDFITKENIEGVWKYLKQRELKIVKIFYLYYISDLKIKDIAKELEMNESTVKNKLYRTLKELKEILGKEVI